MMKRNLLLAAALLFAVLPGRAADYVLAYVNGNTTYYLARNGTTGVQRVTTFDPTTCIWHCASNTAGTTAGTLNNSNTYGYLYQTVNGTTYFLAASANALALATTASANDRSYTRWRTNGTYVYNRYRDNNNNNYYINLASDVARNTTANTASNAIPYEVTTSTVESTSTPPTIDGAAVLTATGTSNYSASGATYQQGGYTNYRFNNVDHYGITPVAANVSYSWALSSSYATVNNSGVVTVSSLPENDVTLTLTVTATFSGGTPAVPAGTTLSASKEITLWGTSVATPTLTRSGNNVTLATATSGATIYYTTDGSEPTSSSAVYSGPIDIAGLSFPVTVKAIAIRNGNSSDPASETYSQPACEMPVITVSSTGVVTITCATEGATIRYTSGDNPADPTGSSTVFSTLTLTSGQSIKAIATKSGYDNSAIATAEYVESGVSGGIVTLDDREDHNWSYYQPINEKYDNYPRRMCSPYPRNVKITYYGYGASTLSTSAVAAPAANTFNTNTTSSDVKVGIGEDGHTFVYYKTLERDANNRFPYELIPNPFYVRPNSGTTYTGFYKWRVKSVSNGTIYTASSGGTAQGVGSMLDAMTTYYFQPTDNARTNANNATSMTVELEALWAPAEVIASGNSFSNNYNSVERSFMIVSNATTNTLDAVKVATPCTYTSFYPNGTTNGTTAATLANRNTRRATFTPTADSKVEYMLLNGNNYNINADAHNLTLGRGIDAAGGTYCANNFYPVNENKTADLDFTLRIESGVFNRVYLMSNGNSLSGRVQNYFIWGSDYDRANGDDSKLDVAQENQINFGTPSLGQSNKDLPTLTCVVKSGQYQRNYWNNNNNSQYNYSFYCHSTTDDTYPGLVSMTVEGGHFASINGGRGSQTAGRITEDSLAFTMRMRGGLVDNSIYGASSNNPTYGSRRLIFTGGEVRGWIAPGCNGTGDDNQGQTNGDSYVYVGGNAKVGNASYARSNNGAPGGCVFGAGRGNATQRASIKNSHVAIADNSEILHDVFGGGFHGYITQTSNVFVLGGTVHGNVYGGGSENGDVNATVTRRIPTVNIHVAGGLVEGAVYGGSYTTGIVTDLVNIHVDGGTVGNNTEGDGVYGGGYGANTSVTGNISVTLGASTSATDSATINGNVFGGSALGDVNTNASNTTTVTMNKALINGNLFGGALGNGADVNGLITVTINGGFVNGNVYGGGDAAAYGRAGQNYPVVNMTGGKAVKVFGGGKGSTAAVTGNPTVTLSGNAHVTGNVYGGGDEAIVTGNTSVILKD